jgi:hypothetical protein
MLTQEHKNLIQLLVDKTNGGSIIWGKAGSRYSFLTKARENTFRIDKYFAGDDSAPCLNLSTFNIKGDLLLDIVLCKGIPDQINDYDLLNALYSKVEREIAGDIIQKDIPVVTSITQSLQQI